MRSGLYILGLLLLCGVSMAAQGKKPAISKDPSPRAENKPVSGGNKLVFVQAVWRHGDRAPGDLPYPNDKNGEDKWPRGWNQLTNEGMRQLKDLGQFFNQRYAGKFVNQTYKVKEVLVQSSDKARAIVSAQSMLNGFFPPAKHETFEEGLNWHPIPVHVTGTGEEDPLLKPTKFACPEYDDELKVVSKEFRRDLVLKNAELLKFVRENAGFNNFGVEELKAVAEVSKEVDHGMKQPEWLQKKWPKQGGKTTLELVKELALQERLNRLSTPKLAKLRGGYLLGDWINRAFKVSMGKQRNPSKMMLYSSHDGTLQSFLHVLGVAEGVQVPYGAAVFMEIYRDQKEQYSVKLLFRHGKEVSTLKVKGCDEVCPFQKFVELLEKNAFYDKKELFEACGRDDFCAPSKPNANNSSAEKKKKFRKKAYSSRG